MTPADLFEPSPTKPTRFGCFLSPLHPIGVDPNLLLADDLALVELADQLGLDEFWIGEHHSGGWGIIGSPEVFIATAAERTRRIALATGVVAAPYHHPFMVAERALLLDHLTRGRFLLGLGAGSVPADMAMLGIDVADTRRRLRDSATAIALLLKGETVTARTDWFTLQDARLQLRPWTAGGPPLVVASAATPSGMQLAGDVGAYPLSHAAPPWGALRPAQSIGIERLADQWEVYRQAALAGGHLPDRTHWRVVIPVHVSTDRSTALGELFPGWERMRRELWSHNFGMPMSRHPQAAERAFDATLAQGGIIAGSAADCAAQIAALAETAGGFGMLLIGCLDWAEAEQQRRSLQLFARHVVPALRESTEPQRASAVRAREQALSSQDDHHAAALAAGPADRGGLRSNDAVTT